MASIPLIPGIARRHGELSGSKRIIAYAAAFFLVFLLWASLAKVDEGLAAA